MYYTGKPSLGYCSIIPTTVANTQSELRSACVGHEYDLVRPAAQISPISKQIGRRYRICLPPTSIPTAALWSPTIPCYFKLGIQVLIGQSMGTKRTLSPIDKIQGLRAHHSLAP